MAVINTNILALNSQTNLNRSASALGSAIERLSSGLRINSAKDDAAGQAIANRMTAQVKGMAQAARNANDGISLAQTAEGSLNQITDNLQRIRELTVQAQNGTNTDADLQSIQDEVNQRLQEIDRVADTTSFNGKSLLKSDATLTTYDADTGFVDQAGTAATEKSKFSIQVGANDTEVISVEISAADTASLGIAGFIVADFEDAAGTAQTGTTDPLATLDAAISKVDATRSNLGAVQNRFQSTISTLNNTVNNLSAARSRIEDADYAVEVSNMTRAQILQQAGTSVLAQANQVPQGVLSLLR
ncbi:flagellin [Bordetella sp. 15P40C-2]|uniref:flagellin N-terminal helical domain-containing protein n=1 Tax=Bordetella sp. 15P40C-2 TaxID=2572246 RepID=UPI0013295306|nr:flagellin [Bordetella sp. 15P40C-2]MVW69945.1 flagellin FliC [Bordetella sp. 15P40C-2]